MDCKNSIIFAALIFEMRSFGSDNHSGVHPEIMQFLTKANYDHVVAYGDDFWTEKANEQIKRHFGEEADPFFLFNGTGANVVALRAATSPFHAILAPQTAHIAVDECGAPTFMTGAALKEIQTLDGKLTPENIAPFLDHFGFEHHSQPKVVYISQCTELGTVYSIAEIRALADFLHTHDMFLHVDGARLANAAASLHCSFKEMIANSGVDILSFGGTKNGMMMGEAVISFRPEFSENLKYIRKQSTQLCSKMRFLSCQFIPYLENDLWLKNATHANQMAQQLKKGIVDVFDAEFTQEVQANILLFKMPRPVIERMLEKHFFYIWNEKTDEIRLVTSWDTTEEDIHHFLNDLKKAI